MKCFFCKGPYHPATGHRYSGTAAACRRCYSEFLKWYGGRLHNPIAEAAAVAPGRVIEGEWTEADQKKRDASRARRRKK